MRSNGTIFLQNSPRQSNALMELDVLELHGLGFASARGFKEHLIVQPQAKFWHPREIDSHLDATHNLRAKHIPGGAGQEIHRLDHVQKHLVLAVLETFGTPRNGISHSRGRFQGHFQTVTFLSDVPIHPERET